MDIDLQQILGVVLPMVQDGKKQEAESIITNGIQPQSSGLLGTLTSLIGLGGDQNQTDGGAGGGFDLSGLSQVVPMLLTLIKPEHIEDVVEYITDLVMGKKKTTTKKKSTSSGTKKKTTSGTKKTTTTAKKSTSTAKKSTSTAKKSTSTAKKPASTAAKKKTGTTAAKKKTTSTKK